MGLLLIHPLLLALVLIVRRLFCVCTLVRVIACNGRLHLHALDCHKMPMFSQLSSV